nr:unnamed protein product [Digitaria exilis]
MAFDLNKEPPDEEEGLLDLNQQPDDEEGLADEQPDDEEPAAEQGDIPELNDLYGAETGEQERVRRTCRRMALKLNCVTANPVDPARGPGGLADSQPTPVHSAPGGSSAMAGPSSSHGAGKAPASPQASDEDVPGDDSEDSAAPGTRTAMHNLGDVVGVTARTFRAVPIAYRPGYVGSVGQQMSSAHALLQNGPVAVKKLKLQVSSEDMVPVLEEKFYQEICSLMMAKHKNVVRFLGYCADAQGKVYNIAGKNIVGEERQRFLCFEFLPGCLDKHISGMGYMAPEFYRGVVTFRSDIYSLGIIIQEILTGTKEYLLVENESNEHLLVENGSNLSLIKVVLESWHARFQKSQGGTWLEHVSVCMGIALKCMEFHPLKRPLTPEILKILDELERTNGFIETQAPPLEPLGISKLLDIFPRDLHCCSVPYELTECPVTLTNGTDFYRQWQLPKDTCDFEVLMIVMRSKEGHRKLESKIGSKKKIDSNYVKRELDLDSDSDVDFGNGRIKLNFGDKDDYLKRTVEALGGMVHRITMTAVVDKLESDIGIMVDLSRDHVNTILDLDRDRDIDIMNTIMYMNDDIDKVDRKVQELGGKVYRVMVAAVCDKETFSMDHRSGGRLPKEIPFHLLKEITDGFSNERKLGSDTYANVYMGVNKDGEKIAVKMLFAMPGLDKMQFANEFNNLSRLQHPNIVRLVGYCHETEKIYVEHKGRLIFADKVHMALCFEYMHGGSLDMYLSDECTGLDWNVRYKIIKGICKGLKYLHEELRSPIYHLNLKPANILLDENMLPKITDFSLSRIFQNESTQVTMNVIGTPGYLPPEYIESNIISNKSDIFSLGVIIIKIMLGPMGHFGSADMPPQEFVELVRQTIYILCNIFRENL